MEMRQYTIYDSKAEIYLQPFCFSTHGASLRAFKETVNDGQSNISKHPADYTLFYIGMWDDNSGIQTPETHINLGNGMEMLDHQETLPLAPNGNPNALSAG